MDTTQPTGGAQTRLWNGPSGHAWVDAQEALDRMFEPFEQLLLEGVPAGSGGRVLDVGCGTGSTTLAFARVLGAKGTAVGVDVSEPMIAAARARAERERSSARFIRADAQVHAFGPEAFDRITSRFGVMFFEDPVQAFANLRRAAADDAVLRFVAWRSLAENPFMTTAERAAAALLPDLPARQPDAPGQFAFADRGRVHGILEESGWAAIESRPIDVACALPERDLVRYVSRLGPVGLRLQEVDERTRARVVETVRAAFDPYVHGSEVRYTAACWRVDARMR
jgi:SAM-dependent methyltransferase